jgi:hypothetical protein
MFNTPKEDMIFFENDDSGITHDPHAQSLVDPENRVFYLMHKATVDCLAGSHVRVAARKFEKALWDQIETKFSTTTEWIEMNDLFEFIRPLISRATIQAMCGATFLRVFPEFFEKFWNFNEDMPKLLQGWPRWMMPKAWRARDLCIAIMKKWRKLHDTQTSDSDGGTFDGSAMILRRWSYFSKMQELSEHGVACSDLGILWGQVVSWFENDSKFEDADIRCHRMNSNSMPATFWLIWHLLRDRDLLARASSEVDACRTSTGFDTAKLCDQPLLQSCFAETLRKYTAVYLIRQPEHEDAQILNYQIPRGKMMVINSAMAHMDPRNWNTGSEEDSVNVFQADRFLTITAKSTKTSPMSSTRDLPSVRSSVSSEADLEPHFSLKGYSGAWVPFGGGIHQCPGRHWVKTQMLLSFAVINAAFEIEVLGAKESLSVDMRKYGIGVLKPAEKVRFRIRRRTSAR